ncbi:MAG: Ig-like domain-containing protein [Isosphaeraceae bacterium]
MDAAGNQSAFGTAFALSIDATAPAAPGAPALLSADDSGTPGDGITSVKQPRVTGTGLAGTTVQVVSGTGSVLGSGVVSASGTFSFILTLKLPDGDYVLKARATDAAGNVSGLSGGFSLKIDSVAPVIPAAPTLLAADDSGLVGDGITTATQPRLTGTTEAGATVFLVDGTGQVLGNVLAGADGSYTVQPQTPLKAGVFSLSVRAVDAAGNSSITSSALALTVASPAPPAPAKPALNPADDNGAAIDGRTTVRRPRITGTTLPGLTVELLDDTGAVLGSAVASASGAYSVQPTDFLGVGSVNLRVRARDATGGVSAASPALTFTELSTPPVDFDGDGISDLAVLRVATAQWIIRYSGNGATAIQTFGTPNLGDIPVPGDYDGSGKTQFALFRPGTAQWIIASQFGAKIVTFGATNLFDIPVPGDYDGDGHTDIAIFRPSTAQWYVLGATGTRLIGTFGATNLSDIPVPGDYDGTGRTQLAVYRPTTSQWFVQSASGTRIAGSFGFPNLVDVPTQGDYDGVGRTELAVFRPGIAQWYVLSPSGGRSLATYGQANYGDVPLNTSIASLKKLGKIGGATTSGVKKTTVKPASTPAKSTTTTPAQSVRPAVVAAAAPRSRPATAVLTATRSEVVSQAIESLIAEDSAVPKTALGRWLRG